MELSARTVMITGKNSTRRTLMGEPSVEIEAIIRAGPGVSEERLLELVTDLKTNGMAFSTNLVDNLASEGIVLSATQLKLLEVSLGTAQQEKAADQNRSEGSTPGHPESFRVPSSTHAIVCSVFVAVAAISFLTFRAIRGKKDRKLEKENTHTGVLGACEAMIEESDVEIGELLASGAEGVVYHGQWEGGPVAVKVSTYPLPQGKDDETFNQFLNEARYNLLKTTTFVFYIPRPIRLLRELRHHHIVIFYGLSLHLFVILTR
jgi:hypothetical protein